MVNARRGLYIRVGYSVFRDGVPEDLASVTALTVIFRHICQPNSSVMYTGEKLSTYANTVSATITDADQVKLMSGDYKIEVYYRRVNPANESGYEPYVIDAPVFTLTDTSTEVNATTCGDITIQTINLAGEVSFCSEELEALILESKQAITDAEAATQTAIDAASAAMAIVDSKIDLDGLNSNIRQLKFNTATPVAPTQAGQMAWSDEEGTLALHNGLHTHPIGRETFFKAKNNSGALIANGKAVYAIGSTGANATIGLATTANGDIAQRTIGIATMDIASNGFGDITTFGEVNGINTSGLTEGALVYLGLNGNLTSIEPVAPTPKISLGLCIRSHLTQGRIAVYVRPIARLNKLTDVYAPNLLDGDVLRWNGTALRYEVYNLVNKADLVAGKIPASQLPAYVDDIIEYANLAAFPAVGETGKLYVTLDTNLTYRWSGSAYTEVSKSLAIGITNTTAFRGDWGKIAYDHSQLTNSNPHGTTAAQIANTPAGTISATTVQGAINELDADRVQLETDLNEKLDKDITGTLGENLITNETLFTDGKFVYTANNSLGNFGTLTYCSVPVVEGKTYRFTCYQDLVDSGYICRVLNSSGNYVTEQGTSPFFNHIVPLGNNVIEITIPAGGVTLQINIYITQKSTAFVKQLYSETDKLPINWLEIAEENLDDSMKEKINNPQITNVIANQINGDFTIISSDILMGYTYTAGGYKKQISNTQTQTAAHAKIHSAIIYGVEGDVFLVSNTQLVDPAGPLAKSYYVFGKNDTVPAILISEIPNYVTLYDAVNKIYKVVMPKDCTIFYLAVSDDDRPTSFIKKCVTKKPLDWLEVESKNIPLAVIDEISTSVKNTIESQQVSEEANYHLWDCINKPIIFSGKSLIAFGNSITSGVSSPGLVQLGTTKYISLFCDHVGAILTNKAISGSVITDSGNQYDICKRVIQYATSAYDIVWIAGGTNDYNLNMPIGTYASTDQTTLYGALRAICDHLKTNCPNAVVIFVTPIPYTSVARRTKTEIQKLDTVRSAIYDVATLYGYNVVDGKNLGMPKTSGNWNNAMVDDSDGCHPTELGHSLYAKLLAGKLL